MDLFKKTGVLGKGAYGKVYRVTSPNNGDRALKVNFKSTYSEGNSCYMELQHHMVLIHPFIINMLYLHIGEPFEESMKSPADTGYDGINFVYPKLEGCLYKFIAQYEVSELDFIKFNAQIMLALEYMHGCGYIHRDVKLDNVLVECIDDEFNCKLGDLGFTKMYFKYDRPHTPEISSLMCCPPECLLRETDYDQSVDVWSLGCTIYEFYMARTIFVNSSIRNTHECLVGMARSLPYPIKLRKSNDVISRSENYNLPRRTRESFFTNPRVDFENKDKIEDLIMGFLQFESGDRVSITHALENDLFDSCREMIKTTREENVPSRDYSFRYVIVRGKGRDLIMEEALNLFKQRKKLSWFTYKLLFQALEHFDNALTTLTIKYYSPKVLNQLLAVFYSIVYTLVKSLIRGYYGIVDIIPERLRSGDFISLALEMEMVVVNSVMQYKVITTTIYNYICTIKTVSNTCAEKLLMFMIRGNHENLTCEEAYKLIA